MDSENMSGFILDVLDELSKRNSEAHADMLNNKGDMFCSGRALAYQEVMEIINNRLDIYELSKFNDMLEETRR